MNHVEKGSSFILVGLMMKNNTFDKCCVVAMVFFVACVLGWCYETFLEMVVWKTGFSNRGFLFGPYLPVYGFGALAFLPGVLWINGRSIDKRVKVLLTIILCGLVATFIELLTSYFLEFFTGGWLWDYSSRYKFNFEGRIALDTSIRFGLGGAGLMYFLLFLENKLKDKDKSIFLFYCSVMLIDLILVLPYR